MLAVEVTLTPQELERTPRSGCTVVVIDVLRATTSIVTALENGAAGVLPVGDVEEARRLAARGLAAPADRIVRSVSDPRPLLAGERGAQAPDGFDLGNSPLSFTRARVEGRAIVLTTTNGTQTLERARGAAEVRVACLRNARAAARACLEGGRDVVLACSGTEGRISLEDAGCAAWIALQLAEGRDVTWGDGARLVLGWFEQWRARIDAAGWASLLRATRHGQRLLDLGFAEDIAYCAEVDVSDEVPVLRDGWVVSAGASAGA